MSGKHTKEFRVQEYVNDFEKSLNYMAAVFFAFLVTALCYFCQGEDWSRTLRELLHELYLEPKEVFYIIIAVLPTLPYYFYYTLKDDPLWCVVDRYIDTKGLLKIFVLYEISVFSIFYLLMQGDMSFAFSKLFISGINIILLILYVCLVASDMIVEKRFNFEYFYVIIMLMFAIFGYLCVHSYSNLNKSSLKQNYSFLVLMLLFTANAGINTFFLYRCKARDNIGIISNRIKIIIPILSICTYTSSVLYCFLYFNTSWLPIVVIACWITLYEILLSFIHFHDRKLKTFFCILIFFIFILGIPLFIWHIPKLSNDLIIKWFILIGISIYMAAIKYWGYVFKIYNIQKEQNKLEAEKMVMIVWFRNSILGAMLFFDILLLSSRQYLPFLLIVLLFSIFSEIFVYSYILKNKENNIYKDYTLGGKIFEFLAITIPIIAFMLCTLYNIGFNKWPIPDIESSMPYELILIIILLIILAITSSILQKGRQSNEKLQERKFHENWLRILADVVDNFSKIFSDSKKVLPSKSKRMFYGVFVLWGVYIALSILCLHFIPQNKEYKICGLCVIIVIVICDWIFVSMHLTNYYMEKMKMGENINKFLKIFELKWKEYMETMGDFRESDAAQFYIGNRLRPVLFFMGSTYDYFNKLNDEKDDYYEHIAQAACSLELIHKASIIFDDFIDKDDFRNGKPTFHNQYDDENKMILLGNAMISNAYKNFVDCKNKNFFKCSESVMIGNLGELSKIVSDLCKGCYKELSKSDYERQTEDEIQEIISLETVSLIKGSLGLGYSCFHKDQGDNSYTDIEELGVAFGNIFQWLNDLEPFSMPKSYKAHKGKKENFDFGMKSIALWTLYRRLSDEERVIFNEGKYNDILKLYNDKEIEIVILDKVKKEKEHINSILEKLKKGNELWVNAFKELFDTAINLKGWEGKF